MRLRRRKPAIAPLLTLSNVRRLRLEPGDALVARFPGRLSAAQCERIKDQCERIAPGHKVVVLEGGAKFDVLTAREDGYVHPESGHVEPEHGGAAA